MAALEAIMPAQPFGPAQIVDVAERMAEAARTLRSLPGEKPKAMKVLWPDIPPEFWTTYGQHGIQVYRDRPTPQQIDRCDEALSWLLQLDPDSRAIVWARAEGWSWRAIMRARRILIVRHSLNPANSEDTVRRLWRAAIGRLAGVA